MVNVEAFLIHNAFVANTKDIIIVCKGPLIKMYTLIY